MGSGVVRMEYGTVLVPVYGRNYRTFYFSSLVFICVVMQIDDDHRLSIERKELCAMLAMAKGICNSTSRGEQMFCLLGAT